MGATPTTTAEKPESREEKKRKKERKELIEHFFICVESGAASAVLDVLRKDPTIIKENPPPSVATLNSQTGPGFLHAIHVAAQRGHYGVMKVLLEVDKSCVNSYREPTLPWDYSPFGEYPLQSFIISGSTNMQSGSDIFSLLLESKADVNCPSAQLKSAPLLYAARWGRMDWAKKLLESGADPTVKAKPDIDGSAGDCLQVCLTYSQTTGLGDIVPLLVAGGYDINRNLNVSDTPLLSAIRSANQPLIQALIDAKAEVNCRDASFLSTLHIWSTNASLPILKILIKAGADPFLVDSNNNTILHSVSTSNSNPEVIKYILDLRIDVHSRNNANCTPFEVAMQFNNRVSVKAFLQSKTLDLHFIDSNPINVHPIFHRFIQNSWFEEIDLLLLRQGIDLNMPSPNGTRPTPLHLAVSTRNNTTLVEKLIQNGADVNARDSNGDTPLHTSILLNDLSTVKLLLSSGADLTIQNALKKEPKNVPCNAEMKQFLMDSDKV